jgi:hypothetical protein
MKVKLTNNITGIVTNFHTHLFAIKTLHIQIDNMKFQ